MRKVTPDGKIELSITFDILAFVLDQTPQIVLDAPMNALLDGPSTALQERLVTSKTRFLQGLSISGGPKAAMVDSVDFPSAGDIHNVVNEGQTPRLPVMMTATFHCHLLPGVKTVSFQFADVLGTVVLTTEFPYKEPKSETVDPEESSSPMQLPTQAEVDALAAAMKPRPTPPKPTERAKTEQEARTAIQRQYNRWSKAYMAHDVETLLSILAPGYTLKTAQGTQIKRSEYGVMLKMRKQKRSDTTHYTTEILRITLRDGVAAIFSREHTTDPGVDQKTGKPTTVSYQHDYIDLWVYANGRWLLKGTVTQREIKLQR